MTTLIFCRHGLAATDPHFGFTLDRLVQDGIRCSKNLAREMASRNITAILSSPQNRALQTACIFGEVMQREVQINPDLAEFNRGIFTCRPYAEFRSAWENHNFSFDYVPPGGESVNAGRERVKNFFQTVVSYYPSEATILCVTHTGWIANLLMMRCGLSFDEAAPGENQFVVGECNSALEFFKVTTSSFLKASDIEGL